MKVKSTPIKDLTPDPQNTRLHGEENIQAIQDSLETYGQVLPLVVHAETKVVVGGNGTLRAMKRLGWEKADVVLYDGSMEKARALSIVLNRTGELADWDTKALAAALVSLTDAGYDHQALGFKTVEFDALVAEHNDLSWLGDTDTPSRADADERDDRNIPSAEWKESLDVVNFTVTVTDEEQAWILAAIKLQTEGHGKGAKLSSICKLFIEASKDD